MNEHGFIMFNRTPEAIAILRDPNAFAILALIAQRARWRTLFSPDGLEIGEALLGDYQNLGMSRSIYRKRLKRLIKWKQITIRRTNRGTIAKLISPLVFDINQTEKDQPENYQKANAKPSENHQETSEAPLTNKENKETTKERKRGKAPMFISEAKARIAAIDQEIAKIRSGTEYRLPTSDGVYLGGTEFLKPEAKARIAILSQSKQEAELVLKGV